MDYRHRTLASEGPLGNALLPLSLQPPTSVVKTTVAKIGTSRLSTIPLPTQNRGNTNLNSGSTGHSRHMGPTQEQDGSMNQGVVGRRSTIMSQRNADLREPPSSANRNDAAGYGKTPQTVRSIPNSVRRSSLFATAAHGRLSFAQPVYVNSTVRDPRPVRDKGFQSNCIRNVAEYLHAVRCPTQITSKTLVSPTAKEFQSIFRFLISDLIDPGVQWGKKFEDDVLSILKDLRYPGMDTVGKTAITAPGAPQSWLGLLAMLNWLVDLCKAHDNWDDPGCISDPLLSVAHDLPLDHPHLEDRLLWDFSSKTYCEWFDGGAEEFPAAERELARLYERMAATAVEECGKIETVIEKRKVELHQLQAQEPPLKQLEDEYVQLMSDKTKFIAFIELHKQKAEKTKQAIIKFRMVIAGQEAELDGCRVELRRIEYAVADQNLAPEEVTRMNHERESLGRTLEELRARITEASQTAYDHEMAVTKSMDRFESLLAEYSSLGHQIGLSHTLTDHAISQDSHMEFAIDLDLGAEDLDGIRVIGEKMRTTIWQGLQAYREMYRLQAQQLRNDIIALEDRSDRAEQNVDKQSGEAVNLEARLKVVHEQAEEAQSLLAIENSNNNKIIAQLESEVTNMMAQSQQSVLSIQSQLESTRIAFKELRHKATLMQDSIVANVGAHIDAVIKAKEHASTSLRGIRTLAEAQ